MLVKDITGTRFGLLTAIERSSSIKGRTMWRCRCACGGETVVQRADLRSGRRKSCGCFRRHNLSNTPEFSAYSDAKQRCTNSKGKGWKNYGGRGIQFRFTSFKQFIAHIGRKPTPAHSLDRINNDGNYEVGNVRWATRLEQEHNKRRAQ